MPLVTEGFFTAIERILIWRWVFMFGCGFIGSTIGTFADFNDVATHSGHLLDALDRRRFMHCRGRRAVAILAWRSEAQHS